MKIYRFLSAEVRAYLSSYDTMTIYHLRDLANGKRKIINCENVRVYQVPQYEGLSIADMLNFAKTYPDVFSCLPLEEREVLKLPR